MKIQWLDQQTYVKQLAEHTQKLYLWCKIIINVESSALVLVCNNHHNNDTIFATLLIYTLHSSEITELHAHSPGLSFRPAERPEDHPDHSPQNPGQVTTQWVRTSSGHTYNSSKYIKTNCPCGSTLRLEVPGPCLQPTLTSWEVFGNWLSFSCLSCLLSDRANDISLSAKRILWVSVYEGLCCFWNLASLSWIEYAETGFVAAMRTSSQEWGLWVGEIA